MARGRIAVVVALSFTPACTHQPAATVQTADLCTTFRAAIDIGRADKTFASLQSRPIPAQWSYDVSTPATRRIEGYQCEIGTGSQISTPVYENATGEFSGVFGCARYDLPDGSIEAQRLSGEIARCLGTAPVRHDLAGGGFFYTFAVRDEPAMEIALLPSGLRNQGVVINLRAD